MKKKILIGSLLVLTLLLLMPSIPAIQQKTIDEGIKQDIQEKLDTISLDDFEGIIVLERVRFPNLYEFVLFIQYRRYLRYRTVYDFATIPNYWRDIIIHPLFFIWSLALFFIFWEWSEFWRNISKTLNWNWEIPGIP